MNATPLNKSAKEKLGILKSLFFYLRIIVCICLIALIGWGWKLYNDPKFMPIHQVQIAAPYQKVSQQRLTDLIAPYTANSSLLSFNIEKLKQALLQEPWVYEVIIKRVWPDQIAISVKEQQAVAIWNHQALLNSEGSVFAPPKNTFPDGLPYIDCPPGQQQLVLQKLHQLNQALSPFNLAIITLNLNSRGSWQMTLANSITVTLGRIDPDLRFSRFIKAYPTVLAKQIDNIASIDLRYPDGFAVSWKNNKAVIPIPTSASQTAN